MYTFIDITPTLKDLQHRTYFEKWVITFIFSSVYNSHHRIDWFPLKEVNPKFVNLFPDLFEFLGTHVHQEGRRAFAIGYFTNIWDLLNLSSSTSTNKTYCTEQTVL